MEFQEHVLESPSEVNVTVRERRPQEYLTEAEVERLIEAAKKNRHGHRDATAILAAYTHGMRSQELAGLRWDDIDFTTGRMHVRRSKGGLSTVHPIRARELRALRRLQRESLTSLYVFVSERGAPLSIAGYQRMVARTGAAAGFPFLIHSQCFAIPVATSSPMTVRIRGRSRNISATDRSFRRSVTPRCRRIASASFGRTKEGLIAAAEPSS